MSATGSPLQQQFLTWNGRLALSLLALLWSASIQAVEWPQEIETDAGIIVVYQPQPEKLEGNTLSGRAAIALELKSQEEPIFGAMWFDARLDTDMDTGAVRIVQITVTDVTWPDSQTEHEERFAEIVNGSVPETGFEISMEQLSASLATAEVVQQSLEDLKTDPPQIIFREELSVLLLYDGEPRYLPIEGSDYERAMNTPMAVVRNTKTKRCYLTDGSNWYSADQALGPWVPINQPPADLAQMVNSAMQAQQDQSEQSDEAEPHGPLPLVVATEPTELISTDGKPDWQALPDSSLLYVKNTETAWVREISGGDMYVLLSGRWYRAKGTDGPWSFVRPDQLPESFSDIPPASDIGGVRTSVAGTDEAEQAMREAAIPQTAAIKRSEASLTVEYDGNPNFESIPGTEVAYAVNTAAQVLRIANHYYAVDNGVWFESNSATGPWAVAENIPDEEIQKIPPSAPVYNTTYVKVYDSTPEVVYVGYTPGYMWSYPYYGVPVYGTGWYYPPYWGRYYYPRTPTWGFHVGYNPWTGWNFGVSWGYGFFRVGVGWGGGWGGGFYPGRCCGGWYGGGYRRPVVINTGNINIGNSVNIGNRNNVSNRIGNSNRVSNGNRGQRNLYNRPENRARVADRSATNRPAASARPANNRANNVYADRSGNVARRDGNQWQSREGNRWQNMPSQTGPSTRPGTQPGTRPSTQPSTRPSTRPSTQPSTRPAPQPSTRPSSRPSYDRGDLNRAHSARQSGYNRAQSRPHNMGGHRGGGRRR